jgi:2-oxoglutarate ferredoxin oxidoreductase subunit gamma
MTESVIIAGSGGQGVMLLGKVLAEAGMRKGLQVSWFPAYGPEVRGGTSHCMVTVSDREIGSPYITKADTLMVLNKPSLGKFKDRVKDKGLLILNSSLIGNFTSRRAEVLQFPFTDIALGLGNIKVANMVVLGCYLGLRKLVKVSEVVEVFKSMAPVGRKDILEINQMALQEGVRLSNG